LKASVLFEKIQKLGKKNNRLPVYLHVICFLLRPFLKTKGIFCFVATPDRPWGCNLEAYFMHLRELPNIRQVYILNLSTTASEEIAKECSFLSTAVEVVNRNEKTKLFNCITRSEMFFLGDYADFRIPGKKINLWHGIPLKKIGVLQNKKWKKLSRRFSNVISAASELDQNNMSLAFNMDRKRVIPSGLPRHDWIRGSLKTPERFNTQLKALSQLLGGHKLVLYAPTFRDGNRDALPLDRDQLQRWASILKEHGYRLGIRAHLISKVEIDFEELGLIDLSGEKFNHIEAIYRYTDILVTDYSSVCIDFMLTDRLIIGLDISNERYDRGFINDFDLSFPGNFYYDFDLFINNLSKIISNPDDQQERFDYSAQKTLFLGDYNDNACSTLTELILD
jgi:CDP-glycerol glycerophosphotransferase (TagB/SpsB family)